MSKNDDSIPSSSSYTYKWSKSLSDLPLQIFLTKYKPSMVQNDGTKPWIWVSRCEPSKEGNGVEAATKEAAVLLKEVTERVECIKNDPEIPMRSNKKTGAKSKKEVRELVQAQATEQLKEIAIRHGCVSGKWLIFASAEKVDMVWSSISTSLIAGPLASTCAYCAKVATSPETESPNYQHAICLYMPDVYDKKAVTEVMKILLRNHGVSLSGVKSNLYTTLGIDSKHPSGIPSTTWKNSALLPESESKELKDAFFADLSSKPATAPQVETAADKPSTTDSAGGVQGGGKERPVPAGKSKLKPKKKVEDDPFASDDDDDEAAEEKRKQEIKVKKGTAKPVAKKVKDDDDDDEEEEKPKKRATTKLKARRARDDDDEDDEEKERPRKRKAVRE